jgi:hypothetical protein
MDAQTLGENTTDAIRYWEPRRLVYNAVLAAIILIYFGKGYPFSLTVVKADMALLFFLLVVLANVAYCSAYVVDLFVQSSDYREQWRRVRWVLFVIGLLFGSILTGFWALAIFQPGS